MAIFIKTGTGFYEAESAALSSDKSLEDIISGELPDISYVDPADDFADDAAAATGGVAVGGLYHTEGVVKIRLT